MNARDRLDSCCPFLNHAELIAARTQTTPFGCWQWIGVQDRDGYGRIQHLDRHWRAHRFAWESLVAPIPDDHVIDHLCRNPGCVNPEHLEPVTIWENTRRGQGITATNARKITCPRGHAELKVVTTTGERYCPTCLNEKRRIRRANGSRW